ncbi:acetyltransferase [uncultured Phenylobacterium sp.]|uniref:acetyltransferase n=1 Tax=uncultured Phenylobacterium sp. TaxID=349273 RepID=UPI0025E6A2E6|nr:acetyltransferase [uncultured Phenylobacterium sp.]
MTDDILVLGAGGHAKVVIELLRAGGQVVGGLIDADPTPRQVLGVPVIGDDQRLEALREGGYQFAFVALGDNLLRRRMGRHVQALGYQLVNAISPAAVLSPSAGLGVGIAVMAGVVINAEARIEDLAIVNTGARIDHDCVLGEACHVAPGGVLAGEVHIGPLAFLGAGCSVIPRVRVGASAVVGAGACVTADIPSHTLALGVPARVARARPAPEASS